jgi:hypothetical protein
MTALESDTINSHALKSKTIPDNSNIHESKWIARADTLYRPPSYHLTYLASPLVYRSASALSFTQVTEKYRPRNLLINFHLLMIERRKLE